MSLISLRAPCLLQLRKLHMVCKHVSIGMDLLACFFFPSQELRNNSRIPLCCSVTVRHSTGTWTSAGSVTLFICLIPIIFNENCMDKSLCL